MNVDVIILSNTANLFYYGLLQRTINTLHWSEPNIKFNPIVVETNGSYIDCGFISPNANKVITPGIEFNYNKFLNIGVSECNNDWLVIANNDLIFTQNWFTKILKFSDEHPEFKSFSPFEPNWHCHKTLAEAKYYEGHRVGYEITGWCLVMKREIITTCELFDETFAFWYQDNDYAMSLQKNNIKHALITGSRVYHETSQSHKLLGIKETEMTHLQRSTFIKKWN